MKALILCNGTAPDRSLIGRHLPEIDLFIAADGGGNIARDLGHLPDLVIGDLDSFERKPRDPFEVIEDPDQETNDLEKALALALEREITEAVVLGVTGRRIDQTLKNLSVLKQFNDRFQTLVFEDNFGTTRLIPPEFIDELPLGTIVSLFPLSGRVEGIRTKGLEYPLEDEALENGVRDGSSNRVADTPVEIRYRSGDLLLFVGRSHIS